MKYVKEKDLFPPLKKHFNKLGYKVYAEVPSYYRCVDFVAVKENKQIAVEMKLSFNREVVHQALTNQSWFPYSYVAVPVQPKEDTMQMSWCHRHGVGILKVFPLGTILYLLEAKEQKSIKLYDFSTFKENENDEAGLPFQKGKSSAFIVLDRIKKYVTDHPTADWKEIYQNVQSHYSNYRSLAGSMSQWKGFSLDAFKKSLIEEYAK